jgi:hypothetical protein
MHRQQGLAGLISFAALSLSSTIALAQAPPTVGRSAPDFTATDAAGKPVKLSSLRGKPVILEWTNNGCPFVGHMYRSRVMQTLQGRAAAQGVTWLSVISSAPGKQGYLTADGVKHWLADTGAAPSDVVIDASGALGRAYDAKATPTMYVIDAKGTLIYMGGIDDRPSTDPSDAKSAKNYISIALDDLKSGHPVADAVTRPYGCSVKY